MLVRLAIVVLAALLLAGAPDVRAQTDVLTNNYDSQRTGADLTETALSPRSVSLLSFGKVFAYQVDAAVSAQPLIASNVALGGGVTRNLAYVATMNASLYAFDADAAAGYGTTPVWGPVHLGTPVGGPQGVRSTPVIDRSTNTIYAVAFNKLSNVGDPANPAGCTGPDASNPCNSRIFVLYAVDMLTGAIKGSTVIDASTSIAGKSVGLSYTQDWPGFAIRIQRAGLALAGNSILVAFSGQSDSDFYNGWVVAFDKTSLAQTGAFCTTCASAALSPVGYHNSGTTYGKGSCAFGGPGGGIWQKGRAPAVDASGAAYFFVANKVAWTDVTYCQKYRPDIALNCIPEQVWYACWPFNGTGNATDTCAMPWPDGTTQAHTICLNNDIYNVYSAPSAAPTAFDTNESLIALNATAGSAAAPALPLTGWFRAPDWNSTSPIFGLELNDLDLSAGGPALLPGTTTLIGAGKLGIVYLLDTTALAPPKLPMQPSANLPIQSFEIAAPNAVPDSTEIMGGPVIWQRPDSSGGTMVYLWRGTDYLKSYRIEANRFVNGDGTPCATLSTAAGTRNKNACLSYGHATVFLDGTTGSEPPEAPITLSANGTQQHSGIIWAAVSDPAHGQNGALLAFNADVLAQQLFSSDRCPGQTPGNVSRFTPPTVANGRVYVATDRAVVVYGLRPTPCTALAQAIRQVLDDP